MTPDRTALRATAAAIALHGTGLPGMRSLAAPALAEAATDVVVYGGTPAEVMAAVAAAGSGWE